MKEMNKTVLFRGRNKVSPPSDEAMSKLKRAIDMYNLSADIRA